MIYVIKNKQNGKYLNSIWFPGGLTFKYQNMFNPNHFCFAIIWVDITDSSIACFTSKRSVYTRMRKVTRKIVKEIQYNLQSASQSMAKTTIYKNYQFLVGMTLPTGLDILKEIAANTEIVEMELNPVKTYDILCDAPNKISPF